MNNPIVLKGVSRKYGKTYALEKVDLVFPNKGLIGIIGPSGSGKSTLLSLLSGLDCAYSGSIKVKGKELKKLSEEDRSALRLHHFGYVFQNYRLLELETAFTNVMVPMEAIYQGNKADLQEKARDLLSFVGLKDKVNQRVNTLSGGEKQRVALARALSSDPEIVLADEPTGALDSKSSEAVFALLRGVAEKTLVILVSHDVETAKLYCDKLVRLSDGKVVGVEEMDNEEAAKETPKSLKIKQRKKRADLSLGFLFRHSLSLAKAKPLRSLLSEITISLGLASLGIVSYLTSSIEGEIQNAFSSLVPTSTIVASCRNEIGSGVSNVYAASLEDAAYLVDEYPDLIEDYGTCLSLDYENWFKDENYFSYSTGTKQVILPGFSMRSINDFLWYKPGVGENVYPRPSVNMRNDQVILGLPYATMFNVCFSFYIQRNYQSLGDYIAGHGWKIILHATNYGYGFEDEELFEVVGIIATDKPIIYHENHRWNQNILLDTMKFRSSQKEEIASPQYVYEIPYLDLSCDIGDFFALSRKEEDMDRFVFEHVNSRYHPSLCEKGKKSDLRRLFVYSCDKFGAKWTELDQIMDGYPEILGRNPSSPGGYFSSSDSISSGFVNKAFLGPNQDDLLEVGESYGNLSLEEAMLPISLPMGVKDASYLTLGEGSVSFSSDLSSIKEGRRPEGLEECVLSKGLFEEWGKPTSIGMALEISGEAIGDRYERDFRYCELKVVGVKEEDIDTVYVINDWTIDAPYGLFDMSPFLLQPSGATFFCKKGSDTSSIISSLSKIFPQYKFADPSLEIGSSISSTLGYIQVILYAFSAIALAMAALLFIIVMVIMITENAHEGKLLFAIGLPRSSIGKLYLSHCYLYVGIGLLSSLAITISGQVMVKVYLGQAFGSGLKGGLSFLPLGLVGLAALAMLLLCHLLVAFISKRKRFD